MKHEIGSEFQLFSNIIGENTALSRNFPKWERRYVLSGRTAISLVAEELVKKNCLHSVALPSYCCGSMVSPFASQGVKVRFYSPENPEDEIRQADAVLVMDYFGFIRNSAAEITKAAKAVGKTVIVDATQSFFSPSPVYEQADYIVASLRKWSDLLCGVAMAKDGFETPEYIGELQQYRKLWREASRLKAAYLGAGTGEKDRFLSLYGEANHLLGEQYRGFRASGEEILRLDRLDSKYLVERRRKNAGYLLEELRKPEAEGKLRLLYDHLEADDCPLFVPVLLEPELRSAVRASMTSHSIYCPQHWPINRKLPFRETQIHRTELSLICDQRYGIEEMKREIETLKTALTGDG